MINLLEKKIIRYIISTVEPPVSYLYVNLLTRGGGYKFFKDIDRTTKFVNYNDAEWVVNKYRKDTNDNLELVVIPVQIIYELLIDDD